MEDDATILYGIESIVRAAGRCRKLFLVNKSAVSSEAPMFLPFLCVCVHVSAGCVLSQWDNTHVCTLTL
jgi:hypothetical protein